MSVFNAVKMFITVHFLVADSVSILTYNSVCVDLEGGVCVPEEDLSIQLEEWEESEEKQDTAAVSAIEDTLLFESKNVTSASLVKFF